MTGGFGAWGNPDGGFNWNMLTNVGAGMLANAEYGPMQAFGKGYNKAMEAGLDQQKAQLLFQEQDNKRRQQAAQQRMLDSINSQLSGAQQAAPAAGGMLQPPPINSQEIGVGYNDSGPNPAAANAANTNMVQGIQQRLMPQGGGGAMPGGSVNIMGMQVGPQQIGAFKMWAGAGNFDKAIEALTNGDPNMTEVMKNYYQAVKQGYQGTILDYQKELRQSTNVNVQNNMPGPGSDDAARKKYNETVGTDVFGQAANQSIKANDIKGYTNMWMQLQKVSGNSGQFDVLRTKLGPWAQMVGIDVDTTKMGFGQAMEMISSKVAPSFRVPGSGNTSDRDIMLFLNGYMKLGNTPEANALISSTINAVSDAQIAAGEIAERWASGELTRKEALAQMRALDPFKGFKENAAKLGVNVEDFSDGVKGGGSTTPGPAAPKPKLKIDPKTMKVVPLGEEQGWLNPPGNNMGYSSGVRG